MLASQVGLCSMEYGVQCFDSCSEGSIKINEDHVALKRIRRNLKKVVPHIFCLYLQCKKIKVTL
jgi:hypothetical protein